MTAASPHRVSYEEYLRLEEASETKHEWCDGIIYAVAGGSLEQLDSAPESFEPSAPRCMPSARSSPQTR